MLRTALRYSSTMAGQYTTQCSPFSRAVVNSMRNIYPDCLAEKSFDNTGLLLESPINRDRRLRNSALLTVDLTRAVADEAIRKQVSIIIAYHPIIFRGLKSLDLANSQQQSLLRLAQEGISVYSPHTAVDSTPNSMADWLGEVTIGDAPYSKITINPRIDPPPGFEGAGSGRLFSLATPQSLHQLAEQLCKAIFGNSPRGLSLALPQGQRAENMMITSIATCPGSGSSILLKNGLPVAQLLVTGELSHHEALAATEAGSAVITLFHSNSERGYIRDRMGQLLDREIEVEWKKARDEMESERSGGKVHGEAVDGILAQKGFTIQVSEEDRDPYQIKYWTGDNEMAM